MEKVALYSATLTSGLSCGIGFAVVGGVITDASFLQYFSHPPDTTLELFAGCSSGGAVIGAIIAGPLANCLGRKRALIISGVLGVLGSALQATPLLWTTTFWVMFAGRTVMGMYLGAVLCVWPLYVNETCKVEERGFACATFSTMINVGVTFILAVEYKLLHVDAFAWCWSLASQLPFLVILIIAVCFLPESPSWLYSKGESQLQSIGQEEAPLQSESDIERSSYSGGTTLLGVVVAGIQSVGGIDLVVTYGPSIFARALGGEFNPQRELFYSMWTGCVLIIGTGLVSFFIDDVGRRALLLVGSAGCSLSFVGASFATASGGILCVFFVLLWVFFFSMSWGPVGFVVPAELVHFKVRAQVLSIGSVLNFAVVYCIVSTWLSLVAAVGQALALRFYAGMSATMFAFVFFLLPETRHRPPDAYPIKSVESLDNGANGGPSYS